MSFDARALLGTLFQPTALAPAADPVEGNDLGDPDALLQAAVDRLVGDPLFPPDVITALRTARAEWIAAE